MNFLCVCGHCDTKQGGEPKVKEQIGPCNGLISNLVSSSISHRINPHISLLTLAISGQLARTVFLETCEVAGGTHTLKN